MGSVQLTRLTKWAKCGVVLVLGSFRRWSGSVGEFLWLPFEGIGVLAVGLVDASV